MQKSATVTPPVPRDKNHAFFRIAAFSTALTLGCATAAVYSVRLGSEGMIIKISWGTVVAFAGAAAISFYYWNLIEKGRHSARWLDAVMIVFGLGLFLYPVRFVAAEKRMDVAIGLTAAVCFLGLAGWLIWRCMRYFDSEESSQNTDVNPGSK